MILASRESGRSSTSVTRSRTRSRPPPGTSSRTDARSRSASLAALRLSGLEDELAVVTDVLQPERVAVDREAAWAALARDKKNVGGSPRLVLLDAPGKPRWGVELPAADVRAALDELIA